MPAALTAQAGMNLFGTAAQCRLMFVCYVFVVCRNRHSLEMNM